MSIVLKYLPVILELTASIEKFRDYILSIGSLGPLAVILFQIVQTVVAPIPGEIVQVAGGYVYGICLGSLYVTVGMLLGAIMAFYFARFMGGSFMERLLQKEKFQWMLNFADSRKFSIFLFTFFFIPGLPKDLLIYLAGMTSIKPLKFFTILLVSRFPWILLSVTIGANIYQKNYLPTVVISVIALLSFVLGLVYKDKLINKLSEIGKGSESLWSDLFDIGGKNMFRKSIPNLLTFANLSFGVLSILTIIKQDYMAGAVFIMISALIDRYDGRIANYLNVSSEFGKELDSLADMVSFGIAPALLIFNKFNFFGLVNMRVIGVCFLLLYIISGCYRLAKYNITEFDGHFTGIPITVAGFILAAYALVTPGNYISAILSIIILVLLAYLMVSKLKLKKI